MMTVLSFNPCFNGSDSKSLLLFLLRLSQYVSILVLMEVTLKASLHFILMSLDWCFNPCFNGSDSKRIISCHKNSIIISFNPCFNGSDSKSRENWFG